MFPSGLSLECSNFSNDGYVFCYSFLLHDLLLFQMAPASALKSSESVEIVKAFQTEPFINVT